MSYGHGPNMGPASQSVFVMGARVIYNTPSGRRVPGTVVGPDQNYFPSPAHVFVSFPSSGFTDLLPVGDLELAEETENGH